MSDSVDVIELAARVRELEAQLVRVPSRGGLRASTDCTNCGSNCTDCRGDRLLDVLLPGEVVGLSGQELGHRLAISRGK
jgi:hypothetical protein